MRAPRRVVEHETLDVVSELTQRGGGRRAGQPGPHDDDVVLTLVLRIDQLVVRLCVLPFPFDRSRWDLRFQLHQRTTPISTAMGKETFPIVMISANAVAKTRLQGLNVF